MPYHMHARILLHEYGAPITVSLFRFQTSSFSTTDARRPGGWGSSRQFGSCQHGMGTNLLGSNWTWTFIRPGGRGSSRQLGSWQRGVGDNPVVGSTTSVMGVGSRARGWGSSQQLGSWESGVGSNTSVMDVGSRAREGGSSWQHGVGTNLFGSTASGANSARWRGGWGSSRHLGSCQHGVGTRRPSAIINKKEIAKRSISGGWSWAMMMMIS